ASATYGSTRTLPAAPAASPAPSNPTGSRCSASTAKVPPMSNAVAAIGLSLLLAAAPPHRGAPPPPHRAAPIAGNLVSLISSDDYPNAALRNEEQGTVTVALAVDPKGAVSSCTVT